MNGEKKGETKEWKELLKGQINKQMNGQRGWQRDKWINGRTTKEDDK